MNCFSWDVQCPRVQDILTVLERKGISVVGNAARSAPVVCGLHNGCNSFFISRCDRTERRVRSLIQNYCAEDDVWVVLAR
jgi:hypothetical protein